LKEIRTMSGAAGSNEYAQIDLASLEASALLHKGETARAIALLDDLAERFPRQPIAFEVLSQWYLNLATRNTEFVERAERAIRRHHELDATNLTAIANLGTVAQLKQDWATAEARYSEVLARDAEAHGARFNRAVVRLLSGNLGPALEDYRLLEEKVPDAPAVQFGLGEIADKQGRSDEALKHFSRYLELAPRGTTEYTNVLSRVDKLKGR
jgi:tetratricopeptide (TPR) repeat protein